ncbi:MAG TPA: DNA cytosine methyltransferase [Candidatus Saccharimonadia bacterium]|nr:DNA cytosine methyltransferase [Candidatus Saccharimonadia bacterium]
MTAYYNEIDQYAAQWLRNLIAANLIVKGDVDTRSILDVPHQDLRGYTQLHFFAGIGGWSYALRLAGWPDDRPVMTGSCPCQPFSLAGQQKGFDDDRHLWPVWFKLIQQLRPPVVFGEQVASPIGYQWLDLVRVNLEDLGSAFGAAVLPAAGVGAPHGRHRIFYVADSMRSGRTQRKTNSGILGEARNGSARLIVTHPGRDISNTDGKSPQRPAVPWRERNHWAVEPSMGRVAHGVPNRVPQLRAYGNAIVPQCAAAFIEAYMTCDPPGDEQAELEQLFSQHAHAEQSELEALLARYIP